ncbi:MAG: diphthine synthase [Archaeoglobus sp.]|nr:diphthine synthase [Archaeoglobus sp.]
MLIFIGTGIWDENDMSLRGIEAAKRADEVYVEFYTSRPATNVEKLSKLLGRKIKVLERADLEEKSIELVRRAKKLDVALLIPGDPMIATTHAAIRVQAKQHGVKTKIIHSSSIVSAVCGMTGLHNYRFGRSATISYPHTSYTSISKFPAETIKANQQINAHTLLFLDLHPKPMEISQAISILESLDENFLNLFAVGIARAGADNCITKCDRLDRLKDFDFGPPMHVLVVLAPKIHITEYEYLKEFTDAPKEIEDLVE